MNAAIWSTADLLATVAAASALTGLGVGGLMLLSRHDAAATLAQAEETLAKAEQVAAANERARWAPAYATHDHTGEVLSITCAESPVVAVVAAAVPSPPWRGPLTAGSSLPHLLLLRPTPTTEEPTMGRPTTPDQPPYRGRHWHAGDKTGAYPIVVPAETRELVSAR